MRLRPLPLLLLVAALLAVPTSAPAASRYKVGIGDQDPNVFDRPAFDALALKRIRYIVPWDWQRDSFTRNDVTAFVNGARADGLEVFVHFNSARGCWNGKRYSRSRRCRAPSASAYSRSVRAFRREFPFVRVFGAWNEVNHKSQPTYRSPKLAARYYNTLRRVCRRCKIVAADLLDSSNLSRYLRGFRRHAKGRPRIWGLHNYSDVNRRRTRKTVELLRAAPGQVWLTETGGIVAFGPNFPYSLSRAKSRTAYMFKLADKYSRRRRGLKSRITRIYPYQFTGVEKGARFDAGLIGPDGEPRPAYQTFRSKLRRRSK